MKIVLSKLSPTYSELGRKHEVIPSIQLLVITKNSSASMNTFFFTSQIIRNKDTHLHQKVEIVEREVNIEHTINRH